MNKNKIYLVKHNIETGKYVIEPVSDNTIGLYIVFTDPNTNTLNIFVNKEFPNDALEAAKYYFDAYMLENQKVETVEDLKPILYEMLEIIAELNAGASSVEKINNKLVKLSIILRDSK